MSHFYYTTSRTGCFLICVADVSLLTPQPAALFNKYRKSAECQQVFPSCSVGKSAQHGHADTSSRREIFPSVLCGGGLPVYIRMCKEEREKLGRCGGWEDAGGGGRSVCCWQRSQYRWRRHQYRWCISRSTIRLGEWEKWGFMRVSLTRRFPRRVPIVPAMSRGIRWG